MIALFANLYIDGMSLMCFFTMVRSMSFRMSHFLRTMILLCSNTKNLNHKNRENK